MAHLSGYSKYKVLTLTGGASGAQTDFQLKIAVSYEAAMDGEFDDIRFTQADGTTLVDAWAELIVTDTSATVWVEFPTTPANTVEQIYRMYYGNAAAASDWDIRATMLDGDDFLGSSLDSAIWDNQYCSSIVVSGGELTLSGFSSGGGRHAGGILGKRLISPPFVFENRIKNVYTNDGANSGMSNNFAHDTDDSATIFFIYNNNFLSFQYNGGAYDYDYDVAHSADTWYVNKIAHNGTNVNYYHDGVVYAHSPLTTNVPNAGMYMKIGGDASYTPTIKSEWIFVRKYVANPPTYAFGSEQSVPAGTRPPRVFLGPFHGPFGGPIQ